MKIRFLAVLAESIAAVLILTFALETSCCCQDKVAEQDHPRCLVVLPPAFDVKYSSVEGTIQLVYRRYVDYPAEDAIKTISEKLRTAGWKPLKSDYWNPTIPSSHQRGWQQFEDHTTSSTTTVNQWMAQWQNPQRDIVSYTFQYRYPSDGKRDLNTLRVFAIYIPATIAEKMPKAPSN